MAPGLRLGWITSSPSFRDHLIKFIDLSTQNPAGFAQVLVVALLGPHGGWQLAGFDRWVRSLCADYQRRRDFFAELFEREVVMCEDKLKEIKKKVGGGRRLNNLISYVRMLEEKDRERKARLLDGSVSESNDTVVDDYRYPPAHVLDGMHVCTLKGYFY